MNKAFLREAEHAADYCPRCGAKGEPVRVEAKIFRLRRLSGAEPSSSRVIGRHCT